MLSCIRKLTTWIQLDGAQSFEYVNPIILGGFYELGACVWVLMQDHHHKSIQSTYGADTTRAKNIR